MTTQKSIRKRATKSEFKVASDLDGRRTPLSGAGVEKADVVVARKVVFKDGILRESDDRCYRAEVKTTEARYYSFSSLSWLKVVQAALKKDEIPLFVITVNLRTMPEMFVAITSRFFSEINPPGGLPPDMKSVGRKSIQVSRAVLDREMNKIKYRRMVFDTGHLATSRNDICILGYNDFLSLIEKAK